MAMNITFSQSNESLALRDEECDQMDKATPLSNLTYAQLFDGGDRCLLMCRKTLNIDGNRQTTNPSNKNHMCKAPKLAA